MSDLKSIKYRQIVGEELKLVHAALAAGNLAVQRIAALRGMTSSRHLQYRRAILHLRNDCTSDELATIRRNAQRSERRAVEAIEGLKPRLLEGFVALVVREGQRAIPRALWNSRQSEDRRTLEDDLVQQACVGFWEAVYGYTGGTYLSTYATTTIRNNLNRYVLDSQARPLPAEVAEQVRAYRSFESQLVAADRPAEFLDVLGAMVVERFPEVERHPGVLRIMTAYMADEMERLRKALAGTEPLPDDRVLPRCCVCGSGVDGLLAVDEMAERLGLDARGRGVLEAVLSGGQLDRAALERIARGPQPGETAE